MEHQKILNLLNEANDSKFVTRKWNVANDNSKTNYLCDYKDTYIRGNITIIGDKVTQVPFKNCVPI